MSCVYLRPKTHQEVELGACADAGCAVKRCDGDRRSIELCSQAMFITKRYGGLSHMWTRVFPTEGASTHVMSRTCVSCPAHFRVCHGPWGSVVVLSMHCQ